MPKFKVYLTWEVAGELIIEADSKEKAEEMALSDAAPLPEGTYVFASLGITEEMETEQLHDDERPDFPK